MRKEQTPVEPSQKDEWNNPGKRDLLGMFDHVTGVWMELQVCHHIRDFQGFKPEFLCLDALISIQSFIKGNCFLFYSLKLKKKEKE